jgi:hypothetical protein
MDTWGLLLIAVFGLAYFLTRKTQPGIALFSVLMVGVGIGIVVAAVWAVQIIASVMP